MNSFNRGKNLEKLHKEIDELETCLKKWMQEEKDIQMEMEASIGEIDVEADIFSDIFWGFYPIFLSSVMP